MKSAKNEMKMLLTEMQALYDAIPGAFDTAAANYLTEIDRRSGLLESTYQSTLNKGYQSMFLVVTAASVGALIALVFYRQRKAT